MTNRLENLIRKAAQHLHDEQVCQLWKIPNDLRLVGKDQLVFGERGPCDFIGHTADGRAILIEAKDVEGTSLRVGGTKGNGIHGHQWVALKEAWYAGAVSILVWKNKDWISVLTYDEARQWKGDRKSIPWRSNRPCSSNRSASASLICFESVDAPLELFRAIRKVVNLTPKSLYAPPKRSDRAGQPGRAADEHPTQR